MGNLSLQGAVMRFLVLPFLLALACLSGCARVTSEDLAKWERYAAQAEATLSQAKAILPVLQASASAARVYAEQTGSQQAADLAAKAQDRLAQIQTMLPAMELAVTGSQTALAAAKTAAANGGGWFDLLLAVGTAAAGILVPGLGVAINKIREQNGAMKQLTTAVKIVALHGDSMERADDDDEAERVKENTTRALAAAGLHTLVQTIRGKK